MNKPASWRLWILFCLLPAALLPACASSAAPVPRETPQPLPANPTAIPPEAAFSNWINFEHLTPGNISSQNEVSVIHQDNTGYLWFGTRDGLIRFDGYEFLIYRNDPLDRTSLSSNNIHALQEDLDGYLWIGTDKGLNRFDRVQGKFTRFQHDEQNDTSLANDSITSLALDDLGGLWVGTSGGGLDHLARGKEVFTHHRSDPADPTKIRSDSVEALLIAENGDMWVGGWNGLDRFDFQTGEFNHVPFSTTSGVLSSENTVTSLSQDLAGNLWIGTEGDGVYRLDIASGYVTHFRSIPGMATSLSSDTVLSTRVDVSGNIWVGTTEGLNLFLPAVNGFRRYQPDPQIPGSLNNPRIASIFQDRSGAYWLGTGGGRLERFFAAPQDFHQVYADPSSAAPLSADQVTSIHRDQSGNFWLGTRLGLNRGVFPDSGFLQYHADADTPGSLPGESIGAILMDGHSRLWVGTDRGLAQFNPATQTFYQPGLALTPLEDPAGQDILRMGRASITSLLEDREGWLWVGTRREGLFRFDPETEQVVPYNPSDKLHHLSGWAVLALAEDEQGNIWVGTQDSGMSRIDLQNGITEDFVSYAEDPNWLIEDTVTALSVAGVGEVWVGTNAGLFRFDPVNRRVFRTSIPAMVFAILPDDAGNLWVSTTRGIYRYDPESDLAHLFTADSGLRGNEFILGAAFKDEQGRLYFGGQDGLTYFQPEDIQDNPFTPPVVLTGLDIAGELSLSGEAASQVEEISLNWPNTSFEFEYAGLSYILPGLNSYAYKLEGFDRDWVQAGTVRNGRYTNLPGGNYILRIIAANNDGVWNTSGISIPVRVVPPLWETPLFRWGLVILLAAILAGGFRLRIRSVARRNEQLERQVAERTREIEQRRKVAEGLRDVINLINTNCPLEESLNLILEQVGQNFPTGKVYLVEHTTDNRLEFLDLPGRSGESTSMESSQKQRRQVFEDDAFPWLADLVHSNATKAISPIAETGSNSEPRLPGLPVGISSAVYVPVMPEGEVFGGFLLFLPAENPPGQEELELLSTFADQCALAISNERLRDRAEESAVLGERSRLARELHDAVTQTLFSASLIAEALPSTWQADREEGKVLLRELRQLNRAALAEMRSLLMELRPSAILESRLGDLLRQLAEAVIGRLQIDMNLDIQDTCRLPDDAHIALYRISQEAFANIARHSQARRIDLVLRCRKLRGRQYRVSLSIHDDGIGFNLRLKKAGHFGLLGLKERAASIGARLKVTSSSGEGTTIETIWQGEVEGKHD